MIINLTNRDNPKTVEQMQELVDRGLLDKSLLPIKPSYEFDPDDPRDINGMPDDYTRLNLEGFY